MAADNQNQPVLNNQIDQDIPVLGAQELFRAANGNNDNALGVNANVNNDNANARIDVNANNIINGGVALGVNANNDGLAVGANANNVGLAVDANVNNIGAGSNVNNVGVASGAFANIPPPVAPFANSVNFGNIGVPFTADFASAAPNPQLQFQIGNAQSVPSGGIPFVFNTKNGGLNLSNDFYAKFAQQSGACNFDISKYASIVLPKIFGAQVECIKSKILSIDKTIKRAQALSPEKIVVHIYGVPRALLNSLLIRKTRVNMILSPNISAQMLPQFMFSMELLDAFCAMYKLEDRVECVVRLGGKIFNDTLCPNIVVPLLEAINQSRFSKTMLPGFDQTFAPFSKQVSYTGKVSGRKRRRVDFADLDDPKSDKYVPKGWCKFYFGLGHCKLGAKCQYKHTKWTDAELASIKQQ